VKFLWRHFLGVVVNRRCGGFVHPHRKPEIKQIFKAWRNPRLFAVEYSMASYEQYIRQAAQQRGIDPDIAVAVARSEGGVDVFQQSKVRKNGVQEPSYGPFQLLKGGNGFPMGMGNDFMTRTGLDPANPANAHATIDFALDQAKQVGWSPWYGAKAIGVTGMEGIGGRPVSASAQPSSSPYAGMADGPKGQEAYAAPVMGSMMASAPSSQPVPVPAGVQAQASSSSSPMGDIFGMLAAQAAQPQQQAAPVQVMGPSPEQANALNNFLQSLRGRPV
jgi:hypothetical protein